MYFGDERSRAPMRGCGKPSRGARAKTSDEKTQSVARRYCNNPADAARDCGAVEHSRADQFRGYREVAGDADTRSAKQNVPNACHIDADKPQARHSRLRFTQQGAHGKWHNA
jgi:hypothetical protein